MIDHRADRHSFRELLDAADVIGVEMRDDQKVDFFDARFLRGIGDSLCIAAIEAWPACVDQQTLAGG